MTEIREILESCFDTERLLGKSLDSLADAIEHLIDLLDDAENEIAELKAIIASLEEQNEEYRSREYEDD